MSPDLLFISPEPLFFNRWQEELATLAFPVHFPSSVEAGLQLLHSGLAPAVVVVGLAEKEVTLLAQVRTALPLTALILVTDGCDEAVLRGAINQYGIVKWYRRQDTAAALVGGVQEVVERSIARQTMVKDAEKLAEVNQELEELTFHMEKTVAYHLKKLKKSSDEKLGLSHDLKRTVCELEGRDRVLRHLLTIHTLDDTLQTILEVIHDVVGMEYGVIHVKDEVGRLAPASIFPARNVDQMAHPSSDLACTALENGKIEVHIDATAKRTCAAVPIFKGDEILGVIEVCWSGSGRMLSEDELLENGQSIYTFTIHAAMAIVDSRLTRDKGEWGKTLDDVLLDFIE